MFLLSENAVIYISEAAVSLLILEKYSFSKLCALLELFSLLRIMWYICTGKTVAGILHCYCCNYNVILKHISSMNDFIVTFLLSDFNIHCSFQIFLNAAVCLFVFFIVLFSYKEKNGIEIALRF